MAKEIGKGIKLATCQDCKFHKNNPSFCNKKEAYVGRKATACDLYKR